MIRRYGHFVLDIAGLFGIRAGALLLSFATSVVLARSMRPDAFGSYAFVIALFTILQPLAGGGLGTLAVRELADPSLNQSDKARLAGRLTIVAATLSTLLAVLVAFFASISSHADRAPIALAVFVLPSMVLVETIAAALVGQRRIKLGQFVSEVGRQGLFLLLIAGLILLPGRRVDTWSVLIAFGMAGWIMVLLSLSSDCIVLPRRARDLPSLANLAFLLKRSLPFAMITAMEYINTRVNILAIGYLMTDADAGYYQVATRLANFILVPSSLVAILMGPRFAAAFWNKQFDRLRALYWRAQLISVAFSIPGFLLFLFAGRWIVTTVFGRSYAPAVAPLLMLVFVYMLMSLRTASTMLMTMSGHERTIIRAIFVGVVGNVAFNLLLIPAFGTIGAAGATAAMTCLTFTILAVSLYRSQLLDRDR